jgi:ribosome-binding protein aMBF1 (putative translation factor)
MREGEAMAELQRLPTAAEVFAEVDAELDAVARARWERTALARAVANAIVAYRTTHDLSQAALAAKLGMQRSAVARLELGDRNPSIDTLEQLASGLDLRFIVDVAPPGRAAAALPPDVQVVGDATDANGTRILVAAG